MKQKKSNRDWILIFTFMAFLVVFIFIGYKLFDIQYKDTNIVVTHDPKIRIVDLLGEIYCLKMEEYYLLLCFMMLDWTYIQ